MNTSNETDRIVGDRLSTGAYYSHDLEIPLVETTSEEYHCVLEYREEYPIAVERPFVLQHAKQRSFFFLFTSLRLIYLGGRFDTYLQLCQDGEELFDVFQ